MVYGVFEKAVEDRKVLSMYYFEVIKSRRFKKNLKDGVEVTGERVQEYETEIKNSHDEYLMENGYVRPSRQKLADKWGLLSKTFDILEDDESIDFQIVDRKRYIGAIKTSKGNYQVSISQHRKPVEPFIAEKLYPHVSNLGEKLINEGHSIVFIKNNQITIEGEDGGHTSIKITKKKEKLF